MTEIDYDENILEIDDRSIELPHPIEDAILVKDIVVVLLFPPRDSPDKAQNVFGLELDGERRWTIDSVIEGSRTPRTYTYIKCEDGQLYADNWNGYRYVVDPETGSTRNPQKREK